MSRPGAFEKGKPNPGKGRPKGKGNKYVEIREQFFCALKEAGGKKFILDAAKDKPDVFLKIVASLLPKELNIDAEVNVLNNLTDDQLEAKIAQSLGKDRVAAIAIGAGAASEEEKD